LSGEGKGMFKYFYSLLIYDFVLNILEEIIKDSNYKWRYCMADLEKIAWGIVEGDYKKIRELVEVALKEGVSAQRIMNEGLVKGMAIVGERFKKDEIFLPEVMISARAMNAGLEVLNPFIGQSTLTPIGKFVIGTVKDDLHDVGKNMVIMMMRGAGFQVVDLGINVPPEKFVDAIKNEKPQLMGMSALLTITLPNMAYTIESIIKAGLRNQIKIMVGGAPVTQEFAYRIGADGYAPDCASAVDKAKQLLRIKT
jgi:5-methyltetrahydrofolate--homocysteine methyltransferase